MSDIKYFPWWHEALPELQFQEKTLLKKADVVIIGSGYTGLSSALTLARAGRSVVILEAKTAGYGASTRNGGQVGSGNQKFTVRQLTDLYGRKKAKAIINAGIDMLNFIENLVKTENIECCFRKAGRFRGAIKPRDYENMARDMEDLKRFANVEYFMVPKADQHREVDTDYYSGGSVLPNDAALHPGLYHRGLLERVLSAGGQLFENTPVKGLDNNRSTTRVTTSRGVIIANEVIVACNGYIGSELPDFQSRLVPVGSSIIGTEELPEKLIRQLLPTDRVYGNTARVIHYFRASTDGRRILFGGRIGHFAPQDSFRAYAHLRKEMLEVFPMLDDVEIAYCWSGRIAFTNDSLPHIGKINGIWYATGYCGTGISRSTWFGNKVALKVLGDPEGETVFDDLQFGQFRYRWAAPAGVIAFETWYRIKDACSRLLQSV